MPQIFAAEDMMMMMKIERGRMYLVGEIAEKNEHNRNLDKSFFLPWKAIKT